jgi:hypothetical protein
MMDYGSLYACDMTMSTQIFPAVVSKNEVSAFNGGGLNVNGDYYFTHLSTLQASHSVYIAIKTLSSIEGSQSCYEFRRETPPHPFKDSSEMSEPTVWAEHVGPSHHADLNVAFPPQGHPLIQPGQGDRRWPCFDVAPSPKATPRRGSFTLQNFDTRDFISADPTP